MTPNDRPVIIVGGGLAGLVAAFELSKRDVRTVIVDQENEANLGGQAFWSLGGLFCVNSAEQRRLGVKDSRELAMQDWLSTAHFDRDCDFWPRKWAEAFVDFATDHLERYVKSLGLSFASVGWAERGDGRAGGHGNSVSIYILPPMVIVHIELTTCIGSQISSSMGHGSSSSGGIREASPSCGRERTG